MKQQGFDWIDKDNQVENVSYSAVASVCVSICNNFNNNFNKITFNIISDEELWLINKKFLNHDTFTDVITFPYNKGKFIFGEIFISADRAAENAKKNNTTTLQEVLRYVFHGVLHLNGLDDNTDEEKFFIHEQEDKYLGEYLKFQLKK